MNQSYFHIYFLRRLEYVLKIGPAIQLAWFEHFKDAHYSFAKMQENCLLIKIQRQRQSRFLARKSYSNKL